MNPQTLNISIKELPFSSRAKNALLRSGIKTIRDILKLGIEGLSNVYQVGEQQLNNITSVVNEYLGVQNGELPKLMADDLENEPLNPVDLLSKSIKDLSIKRLHLPLKTCNALTKADIVTFDSLLALSDEYLRHIPNLGQIGIQSIDDTTAALLASVVNHAEIDWFKFWQIRGITITPSTLRSQLTWHEVITSLPNVVKEILVQYFDERAWIITQRRFGLLGTTTLTLDELGVAFGVSRERIRQLGENVLEELRSIFIFDEYSGKNYHIHPEFSVVIKQISNVITALSENAVPNGNLMQTLGYSTNTITENLIPCINFLLALIGVEKIEFSRTNLEPIWISKPEKLPKNLTTIVEKTDKLLTEISITPISEIDLLIEVNKGLKKDQRIGLSELRQALSLCSSIEQKSEGHYWGKFECLDARGSQVERILFERGEPQHISEIVRELNHRLTLLNRRAVNDRTLGNQISNDSRFIAIGRSGEWGLQSWSLDTNTIVDLMKQALNSKNKPLTAEEIYVYVSERRPVGRRSIDTYLTFNDDFSKVNRSIWGLSSWSETKNAQIWNPIQVAQFVETLFKKHKAKKLQYQVVKQALVEATGVNTKQAQGLLNLNPVIMTELDEASQERYAIFQPDYVEKLKQSGARFKRKNKTLRETVSEQVRHILETAPGNQVTLNDLVQQLVENFSHPDKTFYHYIDDLDYIEKYTIPDTRVVMCRLKRQQKAFPFSQVENIKTGDLKQKVGRALTFLSESDVDIALFLLSKEFEATLKNYLQLANSRGRFLNLPSTLTLDAIINYVEKEGIVTDKAVLHFLRQKRNERAHGTMPSIDERRMMMKYAETTAGMYIDYIKFFDDLTHDAI